MRLYPSFLGLAFFVLNTSLAIATITEEEFNTLKGRALALVDELQAGNPYIIQIEAGPNIHIGQEIVNYIQRNREDQKNIYAITLQKVRQTLETLTLARAQQDANHNYTHTRILLRAAAEESFRSGVNSNQQQNHAEAFEAYARAAAYYLLRMIYRTTPGNQETMEMGELEVQVEVYLLQAY
ncbi:MAG TPA: hypothetical protein DIU37_04415, partial [Opitutae bacterium]|nr:hypothetical protein [Opitutae bacterium]